MKHTIHLWPIVAMLVILLLQGCATSKSGAEASRPVAVVPDKAFRTYLTDNGYAEKVRGKRLRATAEGLALTEMFCYEKGIASLQGIELFPQLTSLVCSGNPIGSLDLRGLPHLEKLYGIHMPLDRLAIDSCHQLKHIELSYTHLTEFDLRPFPALSNFFCIFTPLTTIDLSPCPGMKSVYIRGTQIEEVDITPCHALWELHATDTPLRTIWATAAQMNSDIKVSCSDSAQVKWGKLRQLSGRACYLGEAAALGITLDTLEWFYPNGMELLGDSIPPQYMQEWQRFVQGMAAALRAEGMDWGTPYRLWGRAFFAPDGSVDHYLYNWTGNEKPSAEWQAQFHGVLEFYLATFRFAYPMHRSSPNAAASASHPQNNFVTHVRLAPVFAYYDI